MGMRVGGTNSKPLLHAVDDERITRSGNLAEVRKGWDLKLSLGRSLSRRQDEWNLKSRHRIAFSSGKLELDKIL